MGSHGRRDAGPRLDYEGTRSGWTGPPDPERLSGGVLDREGAERYERDRLVLDDCAARIIACARDHASVERRRRLAELALLLLDEARPGPVAVLR